MLRHVLNFSVENCFQDKILESMAKPHRSFAFSQSIKLHVATNDLEVAQQRWIQEHTDQLRALVQLSDQAGLKLVSLRETSEEPVPSQE